MCAYSKNCEYDLKLGTWGTNECGLLQGRDLFVSPNYMPAGALGVL